MTDFQRFFFICFVCLPGAAKLGPIGAIASGEEVVIQSFSEELGTSGRSNFVPCRRDVTPEEIGPPEVSHHRFGGGENIGRIPSPKR